MALSRPTPNRPSRTLGDLRAPKTFKPLGEAMADALRDIANDMPGVRARQKRTAMRERAEEALQQMAQAIANRDAAE